MDKANAPARAAYDKTVAPAWDVYDRVLASAEKALRQAEARAKAEYDEATPALRDWQKSQGEGRAALLQTLKSVSGADDSAFAKTTEGLEEIFELMEAPFAPREPVAAAAYEQACERASAANRQAKADAEAALDEAIAPARITLNTREAPARAARDEAIAAALAGLEKAKAICFSWAACSYRNRIPTPRRMIHRSMTSANFWRSNPVG